MTSHKIVVLGLTALLIGFIIPLIGYYVSPSSTTPYIVYKPKPGKGLIMESKELSTFKNYSELVDYISSRSSIGSFAVQPSIYSYYTPELIRTATASSETLGVEGTYAGVSGSEKEYSKTNVQVEGVDEGDIVKTNGKIIAVAYQNWVYLVDPVNYVVESKIHVNETIKEIYLTDNDKLVIVSSKYTTPRILTYSVEGVDVRIVSPPHLTLVDIYDVSAPDNPRLVSNTSVSGIPVSTRMINNTLYLVSSHEAISGGHPVIPMINGYLIDPSAVIAIPCYDPYLYYTVIYVLDIDSGDSSETAFISGYTSRIYMSRKHLVIASTEPLASSGYVDDVFKAIASQLPSNISGKIIEALNKRDYLEAYSIIRSYLQRLYDEGKEDVVKEIIDNANRMLSGRRYSTNTSLYIFKIDGLNLEYKGKLTAKGRILDQFAMEEYRSKYLLVATTYSEYSIWIEYGVNIPFYIHKCTDTNLTISVDEDNKSRTISIQDVQCGIDNKGKQIMIYPVPNQIIKSNMLSIYDLESIREVSHLDHIAGNEDIYAARLVGDIFLIVTFRRIDPLFAVNVSDPYNPEIIGFLEIPGYMDYLHPLTDKIILGIGMDRDDLVIRLYDISDPENIEVLSQLIIHNTATPALSDHHAIVFDEEKHVFYIPLGDPWIRWSNMMNKWCTSCIGVAAISYEDNNLHVEKIFGLIGASRTVYINDKLYMVSPSMINVYDRETYNEITSITLQ